MTIAITTSFAVFATLVTTATANSWSDTTSTSIEQNDLATVINMTLELNGILKNSNSR
jgi:hypothetical protein